MASDAMMQVIGRLDAALSRAETLAGKLAEERAQQIETQLAADATESGGNAPVDIDPFSRDKAIAALKSLDALIGDLQKARSEA